ncbi:DUF418 domain-containing protein [Paenibacillus sp. GSMTC-2017]|uniref:DUF418 domain-containing protein n=1 Tax=Paenibacillus sp. GSMTC-2017 TaxID=2794350 RepID=UPI0018D6588C|nr:DUF418 domain-containing protein [Paenibacillus sp. GSMTC-2017]MBH5319511.1 DUF418 domain-containing protein [Paenibacillus sp. GSMTC-2017]
MKGNSSRLRLLDILRGFAVMGTLGTNIWIFAHMGDINEMFSSNGIQWWESIQQFIKVFVLFLINGKMLGLLTIMFGVGLEMKYQQTLRKGNTWPGIYIWTSIILMTEGLIHFIIVMEYDILMSYGVTAIIVAFIIRGGDRAIKRTMKIVGGLHGAVMLLLLSFGVYLAVTGGQLTLGDMKESILLYKEGSWLQQVQYRLDNFIFLRSEAIFVIPMNIFLFLLGVRLMRSGYFSPDADGRQKRKKLLNLGLGIGIPLNLLIFIPGGGFDLPMRYLFAPILALGYIGLIAKLVESSEKLSLWNRFEQVGKMSLSSYVIQNVLCSVIFYGWGVGIGGHLNPLTIIAVWLLLCCFQMMFAFIWLKRFRFGPMESARRFTSNLFSRT